MVTSSTRARRRSTSTKAKRQAPPSLLSKAKSVISQNQESAVIVLALLGVLPAVATNQLTLIAINPFVESFDWAYFTLSDFSNPTLSFAWRALFLAAAIIVIGYLWRQGKPRKALIALPLILAALHPSPRIGATIDYERTLGSITFNTAAEKARLADMEQRQYRFIGAYNWLPPRLPSPAWIEAKSSLAESSLAAVAQNNPASLSQKITKRSAQLAALQKSQNRRALRFGFHFKFLNKSRQAVRRIAALKREISQLRKNLAALAKKNVQLAANANDIVLDYEVNTRLHERWLNDKDQLWLALPYLIASSGLVLWFLWTFGVLNRLFGAAAFVWGVGSMANTFAIWPPQVHLWFVAALYPVATAILTCIAIRFLFRIRIDNRDIHEKIPAAKRRAFHIKSTLFFAPFLVLIILLTFGKWWLGERVTDMLYCADPATGQECLSFLDVNLINSDPQRDTLRDDIHVTLDKGLVVIERELAASAASAAAGTTAAINAARRRALAAFDRAIKPNIWDYDDSGAAPDWDHCNPFRSFNLERCAYNFVVRPINSGYQRQRTRLWNWYSEKINGLADAASGAGKAGAKAFQNGLAGQAGPLAREARKYTDFGFLILAWLEVLQGGVLLMICGRALVTIQARLYVDTRTRSAFTMTPAKPSGSSKGMRVSKSTDSRLPLSSATANQLVIKRGYRPNNAVTDTRMPWVPFRWFISRLLNGVLLPKNVRPVDNTKPVTLTEGHGRQFVRLTIPDGGEVAFLWKNFVACSDCVQIDRLLGVRMPFVIMGHVMVPIARGPGTLVLRTYGQPTITNGQNPWPSVTPNQLLAFSVGSKFSVFSARSWINVYMDECHLLPGSDARVVLDAAQTGQTWSGVFREVWKLIRP